MITRLETPAAARRTHFTKTRDARLDHVQWTCEIPGLPPMTFASVDWGLGLDNPVTVCGRAYTCDACGYSWHMVAIAPEHPPEEAGCPQCDLADLPMTYRPVVSPTVVDVRTRTCDCCGRDFPHDQSRKLFTGQELCPECYGVAIIRMMDDEP